MLPTSNDGTINDFQLLACANATLVAGPPIAALEATNSRCGMNADESFDFDGKSDSLSCLLLFLFLPHKRYPDHSIAPWILYKHVKNIVRGINDAFTLSATAIPGAPAVAKNR